MTDVMIETKGLSKRYGEFNALSNVSFDVRKGEVLGFLGPNGAGKSTTMKILTCFIAPSEGSATVNGADLFEDPMHVRRSIGYLPESTPLYTEMQVLEYLQFMAKMRGFAGEEARKRIKKAVEQTSLGDVIAKDIGELSKGYRQRVGLAQALVHEPPILILDEPMSGLDPNQAREIRELIQEIGKERTVILSTHHLAEVEATCDRVLIVAKGKLVADDSPEELRARGGKASYRVVFEGTDADDKKIRDALGDLRGVSNVRPKAVDTKNERAFMVVPSGDEDLRASIFRAAVENDLVLLESRKVSEGLDRVFQDLTSDADGAAETQAKKSKQETESTSDSTDEEEAS